jgi:hypothetical protein
MTRFSQWLESFRKDVEYAIGLLKRQWQVLKLGIRMHNSEVADNIWLTCYALHNLLLDVGSLLSDGWRNGVPSHWELKNGEYDESEVPGAIWRLLVDLSGANQSAISTYNGITIGYKNNEEEEIDDCYKNVYDNTENCPPSTTFRSGMAVKEMSSTCFRSMLLEHFDASFRNNDVTWPSNATCQKDMTRPVPTSIFLMDLNFVSH